MFIVCNGGYELNYGAIVCSNGQWNTSPLPTNCLGNTDIYYSCLVLTKTFLNSYWYYTFSFYKLLN
jgi:hypothetical protein